MKPFRLTFFIVLLIFHLALVIISFNFTPALADRLVEGGNVFRGFALFGLIVFLIVLAFAFFDRRSYQKRIEKLEAEKNLIKAEVFDMRYQERLREKEIEQEITAFEETLPTSANTPTEPVIVKPQSLGSGTTETHVDESPFTESRQPDLDSTDKTTDDPDSPSRL